MLAIALVLAAYHLPPTPTTYWIWESRASALAWKQAHPVCVTRVPDGYATKGCALATPDPVEGDVA